MLRDLGDAAGVAATLDSLGYIHHRLGEHERAVERYQDALLRYAEQGDRFNEADTSIRLGPESRASASPARAGSAAPRSASAPAARAPRSARIRTPPRTRGGTSGSRRG